MTQIDFLTYGYFAEIALIFFCIVFRFFFFFCFFWIADLYFLFFSFIQLFFKNFFTKNKAYDSPRPWQVQFQDSATPQMEGLVDLYADIMCFVCGLLIFLSIIMLGIRFKYKEEQRNLRLGIYPRRWKFFNSHISLETIWTIIPMCVLVAMSIPSFTLLYALEDRLECSIWVKIVGAQWYWKYEYLNEEQKSVTFDSYMVPEENLVLGEARLLEVDNYIRLPVGANVKFLITSDDVLHSWAVPALGIKVDACPGRISIVSVHLKRKGFYYGQCSEICGANHAFMPIFVVVEKRG